MNRQEMSWFSIVWNPSGSMSDSPGRIFNLSPGTIFRGDRQLLQKFWRPETSIVALEFVVQSIYFNMEFDHSNPFVQVGLVYFQQVVDYTYPLRYGVPAVLTCHSSMFLMFWPPQIVVSSAEVLSSCTMPPAGRYTQRQPHRVWRWAKDVRYLKSVHSNNINGL